MSDTLERRQKCETFSLHHMYCAYLKLFLAHTGLGDVAVTGHYTVRRFTLAVSSTWRKIKHTYYSTAVTFASVIYEKSERGGGSLGG